jgi:hypothetical protein
VEQLLAQSAKRQPLQLPLVDAAAKAKKGAAYQHSGLLSIEPTSVIRDHTFLDYVRADCLCCDLPGDM